MTIRLYSHCGQLRGLRLPRRVSVFCHVGFMRPLYEAALRGHLIAQVLYMVLITDALHAITHNTGWFISALPHVGVFLLGGLWFARKRVRRVAPTQSAPGWGGT